MTRVADPPLDRDADPRFSKVGTLFFGIGAQKAGTTWLHRYFRSHPDVWTPALKETTYWNFVETGEAHDWTRARARRFGAGPGVIPTLLRNLGSPFPSLRPDEMILQAKMLDAPSEAHSSYADLLFNGHHGEKAVGDISPNYALLEPETFARMNALSDRARFLFILRDPVARAVSGLRMALDRGWLGAREIRDLGSAITDALDRPGMSFAIRSSRYDLTIPALEAVVPHDRILVMFYEALFEQRSIDRLTDFLGISRHPGQTETRVLGGSRKGDRPTESQIGALRETLAATYDFVSERFGSEVPDSWHI